MPQGEVLEFTGVTKQFGAVAAVQDFSARVEPGVVTGFLGPNGAGKTTTLRILLGLVRATSGRATIGGTAYADLASPLRSVGAALEAASFHPGRSAANHLKVYAQAARLPRTRVDDVLTTVGLADVAGRRVGGYSLGMRQRLGLAFALLGDPGVLVLDEPTNGLDPEGIIWMRGLLRELARQGRTVLVSSHLLTEVQQTADRLLIISNGSLVLQGSVDDLAEPAEQAVVVDAPHRQALTDALTAAGVAYETLRTGVSVRGADPADIGAIALAAGVPLSGLQRKGPSLEEVFLELVNGSRVHPSAAASHAAAPVVAALPEAAAAEPEAPAPVPESGSGSTEPESGEVPADADAGDAIVDDSPVEDTTNADDGSEDTVVDEIVTGPLDQDPDTDDAADDQEPADFSPVSSFAVAATGVIEVLPQASEDEPTDASGVESWDQVHQDDGQHDAGENDDSEERS
jgi:ABC-2 type transport system ATP-binding protein